jgi:hypothetical protein
MMQENEHMLQVLHLVERALEPRHLVRAEALLLRISEAAFASIGMTFIWEEDEEPGFLVLEPVPERPEVLLVESLVLARWFRFGIVRGLPPVDVVVSRHREPRHAQPVHGGMVLAHLLQPLLALIVAVDQVANCHDQIGIEKVGVLDSLGEHLDSFGRPSGAIAEHNEVKDIIPLGQRQQFRRWTIGVDAWW